MVNGGGWREGQAEDDGSCGEGDSEAQLSPASSLGLPDQGPHPLSSLTHVPLEQKAAELRPFMGIRRCIRSGFCQAIPPTHSPHSADTGGPPSGPRDHSLYDLVLRCVTPVLMRKCACRCRKHLAGISCDGRRTGPVNDGQHDCGTYCPELRPRGCVCFIP